MTLIEPRTLKGFRDYLPEAMIPRERLIATAQAVYRSFGYSPIDTPALEYFEILSGKGSDETDRQMYAFEDHGGRRVGMRFDLTVPLARFAAQHVSELGLPFKRYHIGTVWRGENTQRGRYREFMQCDFDTIGTRSVAADIETALVIHDLLRRIGGTFGRELEVHDPRQQPGRAERPAWRSWACPTRARPSCGRSTSLAKSAATRSPRKWSRPRARRRNKPAECSSWRRCQGTNDEVLTQLGPLVAGNAQGEEGVERLRQILRGAKAGGVTEKRSSWMSPSPAASTITPARFSRRS